MLLILDANEYILAFSPAAEEHSKSLLDIIVERHPLIPIRISRLIINEVRANLTPDVFSNFIGLILDITTIDEDFLVPFELGAKYEAKGLKSADALIAAYTEWTGADVLVTENRHFLSRQTDLPFKVLTAHDTLKFIKTSKSK